MPETQQPLRRDMSYRKPVPKFVPSPTPAPPSLPPSPTPQKFSMSVEYVMCDEMPPVSISYYCIVNICNFWPQLPPGWRDAINRATSKDKWSFSGFRNDMNMDGGNYSNEKTTQKEQVSFPQVVRESLRQADLFLIRRFRAERPIAAPCQNMAKKRW